MGGMEESLTVPVEPIVSRELSAEDLVLEIASTGVICPATEMQGRMNTVIARGCNIRGSTGGIMLLNAILCC